MAGVDWETVEKRHADELAAARAEYDAAKEEAKRLHHAMTERLFRAIYRLELAEYAE